MERRALYNSLRINWQMDPQGDVLPWQVEDYRALSLGDLFQRLEKFQIRLDPQHFLALANEVDSPEALTDLILKDDLEDHEEEDQVYLLVFELWRRLAFEKQTLSLFCDELDHQIDLYDSGRIESVEEIEDLIAQILTLLADCEDQGEKPKALFQTILECSAHDVEGFIYDFISMQLDENHASYALELTLSFLPVVVDKRWFEFLKAKALAPSDFEESSRILHQLIKQADKDPELDFNLEVLAYLSKKGEDRLFVELLKKTIPLLQIEEDFWDLLSSCEDYFHFKDLEEKEKVIQEMQQRRFKNEKEAALKKGDPDFQALLKALI